MTPSCTNAEAALLLVPEAAGRSTQEARLRMKAVSHLTPANRLKPEAHDR